MIHTPTNLIDLVFRSMLIWRLVARLATSMLPPLTCFWWLDSYDNPQLSEHVTFFLSILSRTAASAIFNCYHHLLSCSHGALRGSLTWRIFRSVREIYTLRCLDVLAEGCFFNRNHLSLLGRQFSSSSSSDDDDDDDDGP